MKKVIGVIFLIVFFSCNNDMNYVHNTIAMENTIKRGDGFNLKKSKNIERNQIVVFELPDDQDDKKVRTAGRIIGLPGEEVKISHGEIYVNGKRNPFPSTAKFHYRLLVKGMSEEMKNDLDIEQERMDGSYDCFLTNQDSENFENKYKNVIISMKKSILQDLNQKALLKGKNTFGWDQDNFGPIKIPNKGDILDLDSAIVFLSKINDIDIKRPKYIISENFYFVLSDNFHDGLDSRDIGLISNKQIVGTIKAK